MPELYIIIITPFILIKKTLAYFKDYYNNY